MKKNIWRRIFVLPLLPTLLVMAAAAGLMVLAFQWRLFDLRGAAIYMFATYALIVACTLYARLMDRFPILKRIFAPAAALAADHHCRRGSADLRILAAILRDHRLVCVSAFRLCAGSCHHQLHPHDA